MNLLFLDTETTGFGASRLIELAWSDTVGEIRSLRAKPPIAIEEDATALHGLTMKDLEQYPPFAENPEYASVKALIESSIVVAHNASYDIPVLEREGIFVRDHICTKKVARLLYPSMKSHRLHDMKKEFSIIVEGEAHSAVVDVAVLMELFKKMHVDIMETGVDKEEALAVMVRATLH